MRAAFIGVGAVTYALCRYHIGNTLRAHCTISNVWHASTIQILRFSVCTHFPFLRVILKMGTTPIDPIAARGLLTRSDAHYDGWRTTGINIAGTIQVNESTSHTSQLAPHRW